MLKSPPKKNDSDENSASSEIEELKKEIKKMKSM